MRHFALTIIGRDRPGIVSQVTEILYRLGCNIEDSSCSILGGQFAMILIIATPQPVEELAALEREFAPLASTDLSVFLRRLQPGGERHAALEGQPCMISVYGADQPGIVYRVTKVLGEMQVNITDLNTKLIGTEERPVYVMMLEALLPPGLEVDDLRRPMAELKQALAVDITVRPIDAVEL